MPVGCDGIGNTCFTEIEFYVLHVANWNISLSTQSSDLLTPPFRKIIQLGEMTLPVSTTNVQNALTRFLLTQAKILKLC